MQDAPASPHPVHRLYTETEDGATVVLQTRPHTPYKWRFLTVFTPATAFIATLDRPSAYHRTLLFCMATLDTQQYRTLSAREIAEGTGLAVVSVTRALAMLEADGVICHKGETAARRRRLNNRLCWTSRADAHAAALPDPEMEDARGR